MAILTVCRQRREERVPALDVPQDESAGRRPPHFRSPPTRPMSRSESAIASHGPSLTEHDRRQSRQHDGAQRADGGRDDEPRPGPTRTSSHELLAGVLVEREIGDEVRHHVDGEQPQHPLNQRRPPGLSTCSRPVRLNLHTPASLLRCSAVPSIEVKRRPGTLTLAGANRPPAANPPGSGVRTVRWRSERPAGVQL